MGNSPSRMIDVFCHILPPRYKEALNKIAKPSYWLMANDNNPDLTDMDMRFKITDKYEGLTEVLTLACPALEHVLGPKDAVELARMANDEMAELVAKNPHRFVAAVGALPMNDVDAALKETDRCIKDLNFKGVQIFTPIEGKPLDSPEFLDLYHKMEEYDLPIWIHPTRDWDVEDYPGEGRSKYKLFAGFGWPYETTIAMARLALSGTLEKYPKARFISHHTGGMIPYFEARWGHPVRYTGDKDDVKLSKPAIEWVRTSFYADTANSGSAPGLMCGHAFFGTEHLLFGSDYPYSNGEAKMVRTIEAIKAMSIPEGDKEKIFHTNAEKLLRLSA